MPGIPPYEARDSDEDAERTAALQAWVAEFLATDDLPELRTTGRWSRGSSPSVPTFRSVSDAELVAHLRELVPPYRSLFDRHITVSAASGFGVAIATQVCAEVGRPRRR